jgi:hypothetical protein
VSAVAARAFVVAEHLESVASASDKALYEQPARQLGVGEDDEIAYSHAYPRGDDEAIAGLENGQHARPLDLDAPEGKQTHHDEAEIGSDARSAQIGSVLPIA